MKKGLVGLVSLLIMVSCESTRQYRREWQSYLAERDAKAAANKPQLSPADSFTNDYLEFLTMVYLVSHLSGRPPQAILQPYFPYYSYDQLSSLLLYESILRHQTLMMEWKIRDLIEELKREAAKIRN
ncbi:MAG: hypothetical protein WBC70_18235 [Candidatus Aminicenantales bacterium]